MKRTTAPPFRRIVDAITAQIASGELAPGAKLPSTRQLAKDWRVALATAAHALRTLANDNMVQAVPRVGNVVASARAGTRIRSDTELSREKVVRAAIAIADAEGLDALSIRGVAAKLGVSPMSLYRHIDSRQALVMLMTAAAFEEETLPSVVPDGWRAQLEVAARVEWRILRRHVWLARVVNFTRPQPLPIALEMTEWVLRALEGHGVSAAERMKVHITLHGYIQGLAVNFEEETKMVSETGMTDDEWMQTQEAKFAELARRLPAFGRFNAELPADFAIVFDQMFDFGLQILLDGIGAKIDRLSRRGKR